MILKWMSFWCRKMDRDTSETFNNSNIEKQGAYYLTGKRLVFSQQWSRRGIVSVTYRLALQRDDETQRENEEERRQE